MSGFEHLLTLCSFVLALAMATILVFVGKLYRRRDETVFSWPHGLWMGIVFLNQVGFWLGAFNFHEATRATYPTIAFVILQPVVLFLQSSLIVADEEPFDLRAHHLENRAGYLGLCLVSIALESAFMAHATGGDMRIHLGAYLALQGLAAAAIALAMATRKGVVQLAAPATVLLLQLVNLYFASEGLARGAP